MIKLRYKLSCLGGGTIHLQIIHLSRIVHISINHNLWLISFPLCRRHSFFLSLFLLKQLHWVNLFQRMLFVTFVLYKILFFRDLNNILPAFTVVDFELVHPVFLDLFLARNCSDAFEDSGQTAKVLKFVLETLLAEGFYAGFLEKLTRLLLISGGAQAAANKTRLIPMKGSLRFSLQNRSWCRIRLNL